MSKVRTALVIGGGVAGPVMATALLKAGIEATVHEAYPGPSDGIGGALSLEPNGQAALAVIGADAAFRAVSVPITRSVLAMGEKIRVEMPGLKDLRPRYCVERGELHRVLREHAVAAGVRFEFGKRLVSVDEHPDGITARFTDGSSATADVLIGADGVRSTVRTLIDPAAPSADYTGILGFGASIENDPGLGLEPGTMVFAFGKQAYYLYWAMPDGTIAWGANLPSTQYLTVTEARAIPAEQWLRTLRETYASDDPGQLLTQATTPESLVVTGALHIMPPVPHWHRGRMVLVGDSVHAPSNSTGQGASLAIDSAIQLARCLRDLPDATSGFTAYESMRRKRVETITKRGARLNHTKTPGPVARKMMKTLMPIMFKVMNIEKTMGTEQRYVIDWDAPVQPASTTRASV